jgi:hypothetical protein
LSDFPNFAQKITENDDIQASHKAINKGSVADLINQIGFRMVHRIAIDETQSYLGISTRVSPVDGGHPPKVG